MIRTFVVIDLIVLSAMLLFAASEAPVPRIARTLTPAKAAECSARAAHNAELKLFLQREGLPVGDAASNIVARTAALRELNASLTNAAAIQPPAGKHSKDWLLGFSAGAEAARQRVR